MVAELCSVRCRLFTAVATILFATSGTALAQVASAPLGAAGQSNATPHDGASKSVQSETSDELVEIVVTARRREESIQDVPVAITALSGDDIRDKRIESIQDLQDYVPSMNVVAGPPGYSNIVIRGMGATPGYGPGAVLGGGGTGVVSYFDDAVSHMSDRGLYYDLDNVQVVAGPQGTLFGKNTTGGVVLYVPKAPGDNHDGYFEGSAGNYGLKEATGAVNIPIISDTLLMRVSGQYFDQNGYTIDRGPNFPGKDYDNQNYSTERVSLLFKPFSGFENSLVLSNFNSHTNGPSQVLTASNPAGPFASALDPIFAQQQAAGPRSVSYSDNQIYKEWDYGLVNTTKVSLFPGLDFKNIVSYQVQKEQNSNDEDGSPIVLLDLVGVGKWHLENATVTEEPQLQANGLDGNLIVTAGGYYETSHNTGPQPYQVNLYFGGFTIDQTEQKNSERSKGIYFQDTFDFGELSEAVRGLKLTTGYRYTWDDYGYGAALVAGGGNACISAQGLNTPQNNYCQYYSTGTNSGDSWTLGLDYKLNEKALLYIRSGHGYIPGGFNPGIVYSFFDPNLPQYRFLPETDTDVEVGTKSEFDIGQARVSVDADIFRTAFSNMQRGVTESVSPAGGGVGIPSGFTANATSAVIQGFELQTNIRPVQSLKLGLTYSYNSGKFTKIDPLAAPSLVGIPFANLPTNKVALTGTYYLPVPGTVGQLSVTGSYTYQSQFYDGGSLPVYPQDYIKAYGLTNLRVDWDGIGGSLFGASLFVTNLTNNTYRDNVADSYASNGYITSQFGPPRMYGLQVKLEW